MQRQAAALMFTAPVPLSLECKVLSSFEHAIRWPTEPAVKLELSPGKPESS